MDALDRRLKLRLWATSKTGCSVNRGSWWTRSSK